ncbi:hypothetical protein D1872_202450 [compost metagenome]
MTRRHEALTDSSVIVLRPSEGLWVPLELHRRKKGNEADVPHRSPSRSEPKRSTAPKHFRALCRAPLQVGFCLIIKNKGRIYKQRIRLRIFSQKNYRNLVTWSNTRRLRSLGGDPRLSPIDALLSVTVSRGKRKSRGKRYYVRF